MICGHSLGKWGATDALNLDGGGSSTLYIQGYGKVKFADLYAETVLGQLDKGVEDKINEILSKVSQ